MAYSQGIIPEPRIAPALQHLCVPLHIFLHSHPHIDRLAVGGLIFYNSSKITNTPRLLLLQRAISGGAFPYAWEPPGGTCESKDKTILHSLVREVLEETGMRVIKIEAQIGNMECATLKGVRWAKICFLIKVDEMKGDEEMEDIMVTIERKEHSAFTWAAVEDIESVKVMTQGQRDIMRTGFGYLKSVGMRV